MCIISRVKEVLAGNFSQEKYVHDVTSFHLATLATSFLFVFYHVYCSEQQKSEHMAERSMVWEGRKQLEHTVLLSGPHNMSQMQF